MQYTHLHTLINQTRAAGGTFALYSLICRHAGMRPANNGAPDASDVTLSHYRSVAYHTNFHIVTNLQNCQLWGLQQHDLLGCMRMVKPALAGGAAN